jgi:hypothetical protein
MLWTQRYPEFVVACASTFLASLAVILPFGAHVWGALAILAIITVVVSLVSLLLALRWPTLVFGVGFPALAALNFVVPRDMPDSLGLLAQFSLMFVPLFFVLASVFLTGALVKRRTAGMT